jgi:hypothetical protein
MATTAELVARGSLVVVDALGEGRKPWRQLLAFPAFIQWLDKSLPTFNDFYSDSAPEEQIGALFEAFCLGRPLLYRRDLREIYPTSYGGWELKTPAIRIFGWFRERDCFVCTFGDSADRVKKHRLVHGYLTQTAYLRSTLGLDAPDHVAGVQYNDILSDAPHR